MTGRATVRVAPRMKITAHAAHIVQIPATTKNFSISPTLITGRFYLLDATLRIAYLVIGLGRGCRRVQRKKICQGKYQADQASGGTGVTAVTPCP